LLYICVRGTAGLYPSGDRLPLGAGFWATRLVIGTRQVAADEQARVVLEHDKGICDAFVGVDIFLADEA
jgi:hypothetical protein